MRRFLGSALLVALIFACGGGGGGGGEDQRRDATDAADVSQGGGEVPDGPKGADSEGEAEAVEEGDFDNGGQGEEVGPTLDSGQEAGESDPGEQKDGQGTYHPEGWASPSSQNFHGDAAKQGIAECISCHGQDLTGGSVGVSCETCHSGFKTNCTFCHGGVDTDKGSPPVDIHGNTATSEVTVGAHTAHVTGKSGLTVPLDCTACHKKPSNALDPGHIDGSPAEVVSEHGWDRKAATCTSSYCHGNFTGGNSQNHPVWTKEGQAECGSCHELPPKTGRHPSVFSKHAFMGKNCSNCHNGLANDGATQVLNPAKHINGQKDVSLKSGTYDPATKTCDPACHGPKQW